MPDNIDMIGGMALLEQALRLEQAQAIDEHPSLSKLSEGMPLLLELANNNQVLLEAVAKKLDASAEVVRDAAIAYLKVAYLQHTDNPYRVFGLSPWATMDEVKKRHRFLIRLFHPDRGLIGQSAEMDYAANINRAYTTIRSRVKGAATKSYQPQPYTGNFDVRAGDAQNTQSDVDTAKLIDQLTLHIKRLASLVAKIDYRRHFSSGFGLLSRLLALLLGLLAVVYGKAIRVIAFSFHVLQRGLGQTKRLSIYFYQLLMRGIGKLLPTLGAAASAVVNFRITAFYLRLLAISTVSIGFVVAGGVELSQNAYINVEQYFSAKELAQAQAEAREHAARQLALKQKNTRIEAERIATEKTEVLLQLALNQEQARIEANREEEARQLAEKQEQKRKEAELVEAQKDKEARQLALKEEAHKESIRIEAAKKVALKQEQARIEDARIAAEKNESARQLALKQEQLRKEEARQLALKQEQARIEAARIAAEKNESARQLALKQEQVRKEEARQLALKQEQARIEAERIAAEKIEVARQLALKQEQEQVRKEEARQLALKQEQARIEAERIAAEKIEVARQSALKNEAARQVSDQASSQPNPNKKSVSLRLSRVLIDAASSQKHDEKPIANIGIDAN